jgi:hypothetical protein
MMRSAVAEHDITCYKMVMRTRGMRRGKYLSWFRDFEYKLGEEYSEPKFEAATILDPDFGEGNINYGFHSYADESFACRQEDKFSHAVIIRCVIPEGARYYKSSDSGDEQRFMQYCSDRLRIDAQLVKGKWVTEFPKGSK